jgi:hypothetical protein
MKTTEKVRNKKNKKSKTYQPNIEKKSHIQLRTRLQKLKNNTDI